MFYKSPKSTSLRLGDILLQQTIASIKVVDDLRKSTNLEEVDVEVCKSNYAVVITPCCSIENDLIVLTPLICIKNSFSENPYFKDDFTNINRQMMPQQTVSKVVWEGLSDVEKAKRESDGFTYAFVENFIFEPLPQLLEYQTKYHIGGSTIEEKINYYMIDFRFVTHVKSKNIKSDSGVFLNKKIAELSVEARSELRNKLAYYYARIPREDQTQED